MTLNALAEWLRCPACLLPLVQTASLVLGCPSGHRFDVNRRGYATMVSPTSATAGDDAGMLSEREALLNSGAFSPIACAVERMLPPSPQRIADIGCGTGYYLHSALSARPSAHGLALDRSANAVRRAIRGHQQRVHGLVADVWQPLPVRSSVADVLLNVFAPRNAKEFARILAPSGQLIVVVPAAEHLHELREAADMLSVPAGKAEALIAQFAGHFTFDRRSRVHFELVLSAEQANSLRAMGPSAHHAPRATTRVPRTVTVAVDVLRFIRSRTTDGPLSPPDETQRAKYPR